MAQILWFRRDLRLIDNAVLSNALGEVLPIFIFDTDILDNLPKDDKRVPFIYDNVIKLKEQLKQNGFDLHIFYGKPLEIFTKLKNEGFDEVLCSCDFDSYAIKRDNQIEQILSMKRFYDSFILHPNDHLKADNTPYKVFTPFYKALAPLWESYAIDEYKVDFNHLRLKQISLEDQIPSLQELGFDTQEFPDFLHQDAFTLLDEFIGKIANYKEGRDFFNLDATSKISVHLRFGLISPRQIFNYVKKHASPTFSEFYIRELFWREFWNYILFHFPQSEDANFNGLDIEFNDSDEDYEKFIAGLTGVPIVDAAIRQLNKTGVMHNRLRMIVASFATKNLLIDWKKCEQYFALKLLDYEASSNVGSWQWASGTGADAAPYFRIFNPYTQAQMFDKDAQYIKSQLPELNELEPKTIHTPYAIEQNMFIEYPPVMINIEYSRKRVIEKFKEAKDAIA